MHKSGVLERRNGFLSKLYFMTHHPEKPCLKYNSHVVATNFLLKRKS